MNLNIRLFATLKDRAKASQISVDISEPATVSDLLASVSRQYPAIESALEYVLISVNQEYADRTQSISSEDEIALFPPVSGG
ncbi:MAG: MoaD/ThiS family protein [Anaerolineae bacterium]|jgi:molybdopterin synthase catalytic subunit|nr:MoaD/ThiS family protein [Anaerolineae bacterium]MBT6322297.1 MoaD/ThiS family protein [Anaerolineae bacterium]MBT7018161.1 MoaD/ThiS family protein [Anaerolineae bacterium]MBT7602208.1 MoaD/ThiS family protein [Anaerolineae bacterium]MBT7776098.1 MoaD/ThiS family protein [Anaerolineae bacterium]